MPDTLVFNVDDEPRWYYTDKVRPDNEAHISNYHKVQCPCCMHMRITPYKILRFVLYRYNLWALLPVTFRCVLWRIYLALVSEILA